MPTKDNDFILFANFSGFDDSKNMPPTKVNFELICGFYGVNKHIIRKHQDPILMGIRLNANMKITSDCNGKLYEYVLTCNLSNSGQCFEHENLIKN